MYPISDMEKLQKLIDKWNAQLLTGGVAQVGDRAMQTLRWTLS